MCRPGREYLSVHASFSSISMQTLELAEMYLISGFTNQQVCDFGQVINIFRLWYYPPTSLGIKIISNS